MSLYVPQFSKPSKAAGNPSPSLVPSAPGTNPAILGLRNAQEKQAQQKAVWKPDSDVQRTALASPADIIGYGGAAGGGKTDLLVGTSLTEHHRAIIFRRQYGDLKGIIRRAKEITEETRTSFNANENLLSMPGGRSLEFGAMKDPDDWERFKGRDHDLKGYDEVTEFLESQVRSSMAWCRSARPGQRCRVLMTFNPPTSESGEWVIRFFAPWLDPEHHNPAVPGELRWYAMVDGEEVEVPTGESFEHVTPAGQKEIIAPLSRTFIPARLEDNRYLNDDGEYRRILQSTPEPLRSQLLYGNFNVARTVNPWQVIPTAWVQAAMSRWKERGGAEYVPPVLLTALGSDIAHGGKDKTVLAPRYGAHFAPLLKYTGEETPDGKSAAALIVKAWSDDALINVDAIGYGASAAEKLSDSPSDGGYGIAQAQPVNVGTKSEFTDKSGKFRMRNLRAEMYWRLRELLDPENGHDAALPDDRELLADMCAPTYQITPSGILVEAKADIKARIGRSPDCGDAVALAMLPEVLPEPSQEAMVLPRLMTFSNRRR